VHHNIHTTYRQLTPHTAYTPPTPPLVKVSPDFQLFWFFWVEKSKTAAIFPPIKKQTVEIVRDAIRG
jgi:hypothetical protein